MTSRNLTLNGSKKLLRFPKAKREPDDFKLIERTLRVAGKAIETALKMLRNLKRGDLMEPGKESPERIGA